MLMLDVAEKELSGAEGAALAPEVLHKLSDCVLAVDLSSKSEDLRR